MNKKYYLLSLLNTMIVAMLSLGFTSCSNDNENEKDGASNSFDLVGTWKSVGKGSFYTFNADGTCEWGSSGKYWKLSEGKLHLTRDDGRIEVWLIEYKDNLLYLTLPDGDATEQKTLMKIDLEKITSLTKDYFVGKWEETSSESWDFYANGTCKTIFVVNDVSSQTGNGSWKYDEENRILSTNVKYTWITYNYKGKEVENSRTVEREMQIIYATDDEWAGKGFSFKRQK